MKGLYHIKYAIVFVALLCILPMGVYAEESGSTVLGDVTVTGTREAEKKTEVPATVGVMHKDTIKFTKPTHPSEIMGKVAGVHVNVTGGEGHMTSIRFPITTKPVYLYLEDGIPSRSTGFFNHNALYEVNVPQAASIEVLKGPGTALYGSDAIGGVINVLTRAPSLEKEVEVTAEAGEYGWARGLLSFSNTYGNDGIRFDLNLTRTDGWRDATEYDRQSTTLRWDRFLPQGAVLKTIIAFSNIDQQTAGSSAISKEDYKNNPKTNYTPISYRRVKALRVSTTYEKEGKDNLLSLILYYRYNEHELLPNWSLSYDPQLYSTNNHSVGLMFKYRKDYAPMNTRLIYGVDLDYSPGERDEWKLSVTKTGKIYTAYTTQEKIYDYDVTFWGMSPYIHLETSPSQKMRVSAGVRYDHLGYDYDNKLSVVTTGKHRRPADTTLNFDHISPKLGITYDLTKTHNIFASYRHTFRVPSQSQLFRQGRAENTVDLDAVKADSFEVGLRGVAATRVDYEVSVYHMTLRDDIVTYTNTTTGNRETMNAGKTEHRGVEVSVGTDITKDVRVDVSFSRSTHKYVDWSPKTGVTYDGNKMPYAPRTVANTRLGYSPEFLRGGKIELEWEHIGEYYMDDENTHKYSGYDILNLRANYYTKGGTELFAKLLNLTDKRYATRARYTKYRGEEYSPGMPFTVYGGVVYRFK